MYNVTVLYGHPADSDAFESYYAQRKMPLARTMPNVLKMETSKFLPGMDGSAPSFYRMAAIYFESPETFMATAATPEGQATTADLPNFASGGFTFLVGIID